MPKITGPLIGLEASGQFGKKLTFQRRPTGAVVYPYQKPGGRAPFESSPKQKDQRGIIGLITACWQCMTPAEKQFWEDEAKRIGFPGVGQNFFIHKASKDLTKYLGLAGYWSFNYNVGDKVLDLSGQNNHGILKPNYPTNCPTFKNSVNKKFGKCLYFDSVDDLVDCGNDKSLEGTGDLTLGAWVYLDGPQGEWSLIVGRTAPWVYGLCVQDNKFTFYAGNLSPTTFSSPHNAPLNTWTQVVLTHKQSTGETKLYINGELDKEGTMSGSIPSNTKTNYIGKDGERAVGVYAFKGLIDEVRIYNRVLPPEEIHYHHNLFRR